MNDELDLVEQVLPDDEVGILKILMCELFASEETGTSLHVVLGVLLESIDWLLALLVIPLSCTFQSIWQRLELDHVSLACQHESSCNAGTLWMSSSTWFCCRAISKHFVADVASVLICLSNLRGRIDSIVCAAVFGSVNEIVCELPAYDTHSSSPWAHAEDELDYGFLCIEVCPESGEIFLGVQWPQLDEYLLKSCMVTVESEEADDVRCSRKVLLRSWN